MDCIRIGLLRRNVRDAFCGNQRVGNPDHVHGSSERTESGNNYIDRNLGGRWIEAGNSDDYGDGGNCGERGAIGGECSDQDWNEGLYCDSYQRYAKQGRELGVVGSGLCRRNVWNSFRGGQRFRSGDHVHGTCDYAGPGGSYLDGDFGCRRDQDKPGNDHGYRGSGR